MQCPMLPASATVLRDSFCNVYTAPHVGVTKLLVWIRIQARSKSGAALYDIRQPRMWEIQKFLDFWEVVLSMNLAE